MNAQLARQAVMWVFSQIRVGSLVVIEPGRRQSFGSGPPAATVEVHAPEVWPRLLTGSRGMAETYAQGMWDTPDLAALIRLAARNVQMLDQARAAIAPVRAPWQHLRGIVRRNTRTRSRGDIAAHYDLGNALFEQMLDPTMGYSCAVFEHPGMTLEEASRAKFERVCEKLDLRAHDRVIEIGTGWGGFALHAAASRGCHVTTTTISSEQREYAQARVRDAGLEDRITILQRDYRDLAGRYDKLVSIEMIEAVGWQHFGTFFSQCSRLLAPEGAMLLQAITIDDRAYAVQKAARSFMNTLIFPGGCLPSMEIISKRLAHRTDLQVANLEDLTPHYVETLRRWRGRFSARRTELAELGYDESFQRLWKMYLAYCEAGFAERRICLVQALLTKPLWRSAITEEHPQLVGREVTG